MKKILNENSWVSILVQGANSNGDSTGSGWYGCSGHALLAINKYGGGDPVEYEVFHLVGNRNSSSGSGHVICNTASIERYRCDNNGKASSCGGASPRDSNAHYSFTEKRNCFKDYARWYDKEVNKRLDIIESERITISEGAAARLIDMCLYQCEWPHSDVLGHGSGVGSFSLIGGQVKMGTNCISWAYHMLRRIGVTFDWKLYGMSFVSPRKAIESGGRLQYDGLGYFL
ncbi:hypothetical protein ACFQNF_15440 [Iodobacter arcticus]|uniref:Uncharacterized protein n=1 Tax=Iodobacter arcticus TaxID=590593 RepID=A0ABW2R018_9NEIS